MKLRILRYGSAEIHVKDAHANGRNILLEELRKEAHLIAGWDVMINMVQGIDHSFDALILIESTQQRKASKQRLSCGLRMQKNITK